MHHAKLDIENRKYRGTGGRNVLTCPCGYQAVYPANAKIGFLLDQCDLHDELGNVPPATARRRERIAAAERGTEARKSSNLRYERN